MSDLDDIFGMDNSEFRFSTTTENYSFMNMETNDTVNYDTEQCLQKDLKNYILHDDIHLCNFSDPVIQEDSNPHVVVTSPHVVVTSPTENLATIHSYENTFNANYTDTPLKNGQPTGYNDNVHEISDPCSVQVEGDCVYEMLNPPSYEIMVLEALAPHVSSNNDMVSSVASVDNENIIVASDFLSTAADVASTSCTTPNAVSTGTTSRRNNIAKTGRVTRVRKRAQKVKLYQIDTPFEDKKEEQKRVNAIKARKNRTIKKTETEQLRDENGCLRVQLAEKEHLVLQQQQTIDNLKEESALIKSKMIKIQSQLNKMVADL